MVQKYKKRLRVGTQEMDEESMNLAIDNVIQEQLSYRKAALKYNIKTPTLESRVKKFKDGSNADGPSRTFHSKFTSLQVFSLEEEARLNDYITNCRKMHYELHTEKNELEERHGSKELKKIEQERKARAKAVKRSLKELNSRQKNKAKKIESDEDSEESEGSQFSLRESSISLVDLEMDEETDDRSTNNNLNVTPEKIKDNCYVLVKLEK